MATVKGYPNYPQKMSVPELKGIVRYNLERLRDPDCPVCKYGTPVEVKDQKGFTHQCIDCKALLNLS